MYCYEPHLTDEEVEAERFSDSPDGAELGSHAAGIVNRAVHCRDLNHKVTSTQKVFPKATQTLAFRLAWPQLSHVAISKPITNRRPCHKDRSPSRLITELEIDSCFPRDRA